MRGKVGSTKTIFGDCMYDWGKLYQSLIGYDEILDETYVDSKYKELLITTFKNFIIQKYCKIGFNDIKTITRSLIFSLIPLHDDKKCIKYYDMLNSKYLKYD